MCFEKQPPRNTSAEHFERAPKLERKHSQIQSQKHARKLTYESTSPPNAASSSLKYLREKIKSCRRSSGFFLWSPELPNALESSLILASNRMGARTGPSPARTQATIQCKLSEFWIFILFLRGGQGEEKADASSRAKSQPVCLPLFALRRREAGEASEWMTSREHFGLGKNSVSCRKW